MGPALLGVSLLACASMPQSEPGNSPVPSLAHWSHVVSFLDSAIAQGAAPGAVLGVSYSGTRFIYGAGQLGQDNPARPDSATIYDLASLTKVVGLTTAAALAVAEGRLRLDAPAKNYVPAFAGGGRDSVTIRHLLTHSSGLPAWRPLHLETASREEALALADTTALEAAPGARTVYSDLGIIVLTQAVESVFGTSLDSILERRVFTPLRMSSTRFNPPAEWRTRIAPTENDPWRGHVLVGEVHDENAARLGGESGHAGLFSNASDLLTFAEWLLMGVPGPGGAGCFPNRSSLEPPAQISEFVKRQNLPVGSSRALGWDTPSPGSSSGRLLSPRAFGHTGFTGTSLWIDPERCLAIVLLSNRVHPSRDNTKWVPVRARVADLVVTTLSQDVR